MQMLSRVLAAFDVVCISKDSTDHGGGAGDDQTRNGEADGAQTVAMLRGISGWHLD